MGGIGGFGSVLGEFLVVEPLTGYHLLIIIIIFFGAGTTMRDDAVLFLVVEPLTGYQLVLIKYLTKILINNF